MKDPLNMLNALRAFEAVARLGSVSNAAYELGVTPGAVSKQLRFLESVLEVELLIRGQRSIRLTEDAQAYAQSLGFAFQTITRATDRVVSREGQEEIVIAAPGTFLHRWLYPRMGSLHGVVPGHRINTVTWNQSVSAGDRSVDLFINVGAVPDIKGMASLTLLPERFGPVVSPSVWRDEQNDLEDLFRLPILATAWPAFMWRNWSFEARVPVPSTNTTVYERLLFAIQAAEAGLGVTIAPELAVIDALEEGSLVAPYGMHERNGSWSVSWRADSWNSIKNNICKWLARELSRLNSSPPTSHLR